MSSSDFLAKQMDVLKEQAAKLTNIKSMEEKKKASYRRKIEQLELQLADNKASIDKVSYEIGRLEMKTNLNNDELVELYNLKKTEINKSQAMAKIRNNKTVYEYRMDQSEEQEQEVTKMLEWVSAEGKRFVCELDKQLEREELQRDGAPSRNWDTSSESESDDDAAPVTVALPRIKRYPSADSTQTSAHRYDKGNVSALSAIVHDLQRRKASFSIGSRQHEMEVASKRQRQEALLPFIATGAAVIATSRFKERRVPRKESLRLTDDRLQQYNKIHLPLSVPPGLLVTEATPNTSPRSSIAMGITDEVKFKMRFIGASGRRISIPMGSKDEALATNIVDLKKCTRLNLPVFKNRQAAVSNRNQPEEDGKMKAYGGHVQDGGRKSLKAVK